MTNHNTNPSDTQQNNKNNCANQSQVLDLKDSMDTAGRFLKRFRVVELLGECGAYKGKGIPVGAILLYVFNLIFSPMCMYY